MKKFIFKILSFTLIILIILMSFEIILSNFNIAYSDKILSKSIRKFEESSQETNILFLGDSRCFYGVNPSSINTSSNIHNFSFVSESIIITYWKIKYYLENNKLNNLNTVYVYFDESMISDPSRTRLKTDYDYSKFFNFYFNDITKSHSLREKINFWIQINSKIFRLRASFRELVSQAFQSLVKSPSHTEKFEDTGFCSRSYSVSNKEFENDKKILINNLKSKPIYNSVPISYYHRLVKLLEYHKINVIFYKLPATHILLTYEKEDLKESYINIYKREISFIQKEFRGKLFLDLTGEKKWELYNFSDRGHLNKNGAEEVAKMIEIN